MAEHAHKSDGDGKGKDGAMPFVNAVRLNARQWILSSVILLVLLLSVPTLWKLVEKFETGADYRIPYSLSKDYWLYTRRLDQLAPTNIVMLGDSVVWGEYVSRDGTLSHFLNEEAGGSDRFVNAGVNGLFPLALEGLIRCHAQPLRGRKLIVHCNLLWMTSPKADLSTAKEEQFNHATLVPQFSPRIPCYRADANTRLDAVIGRNVPFLGWVSHLQNTCFDQKSIPKWTLAEGPGSPPQLTNAWRNPLSQITLRVPGEPEEDSQRGTGSARHKPWSTNAVGTTRFEWVAPANSLQWRAFQRALVLLRERDNDLLVVVGPFNEHLMAMENRPAFHKLQEEILAWLSQNQFPAITPVTLPSLLYADASHPLTQGYQQLASVLFRDPLFQKWITAKK
jgi:hypothetical protein